MRTLFFFILSLMVLFPSNAFGQVDKKKLEALKKVYDPWGISITYSSCIELYSVVRDEKKTRFLQTFNQIAISKLKTLLLTEMPKEINKSIAFIQLDLSRLKAGWKSADDPRGEIKPLAWNDEDVVDIADFCDKQLNSSATFRTFVRLTTEVKEFQATLETSLIKFQNLKEDPFTSKESSFIASKAFAFLLTQKPQEVASLKEKNPEVFQAIQSFKVSFSDSVLYYQKVKSEIENGGTEVKKADRIFLENIAALETAIKLDPENPKKNGLKM